MQTKLRTEKIKCQNVIVSVPAQLSVSVSVLFHNIRCSDNVASGTTILHCNKFTFNITSSVKKFSLVKRDEKLHCAKPTDRLFVVQADKINLACLLHSGPNKSHYFRELDTKQAKNVLQKTYYAGGNGE